MTHGPAGREGRGRCPTQPTPPPSVPRAAVLDGITTSSKRAETPADRQQMGFILHDLLTGKEPQDDDEAEVLVSQQHPKEDDTDDGGDDAGPSAPAQQGGHAKGAQEAQGAADGAGDGEQVAGKNAEAGRASNLEAGQAAKPEALDDPAYSEVTDVEPCL